MLHLKIINLETDEFRKTLLAPEAAPQHECVIGRSPNCDLILDSPEVSRLHAKIAFRDGCYLFSDLNSTDGSRLNNQEVEADKSYPLVEEDAVYVGTFLCLIERIEIG